MLKRYLLEVETDDDLKECEITAAISAINGVTRVAQCMEVFTSITLSLKKTESQGKDDGHGTFEITKPGFYRTRDGKKVEVAYVSKYDECYPIMGGIGEYHCSWDRAGWVSEYEGQPGDLVAEWAESPAPSVSKRVYKLLLKANEKDWTDNEQKDPLKQMYLEYLEPNRLATEEQVINAIRRGDFISAEIVGAIEEARE